jgi:hypothetical protein
MSELIFPIMNTLSSGCVRLRRNCPGLLSGGSLSWIPIFSAVLSLHALRLPSGLPSAVSSGRTELRVE